MNKQKPISKEKKERLEKGKRNFEDIWKRIRPFIKKRRVKEYSTTGKWRSFNYGL